MRIEELQLSARTYKCLRKAGIESVEQLSQTPDDVLKKLYNFGPKCFAEVKYKLAKLHAESPSINSDALKNYCFNAADNCKKLYTDALNGITPGDNDPSPLNAAAYFMQRETMFRYEIPQIIDAFVMGQSGLCYKE